MLRQPARSPAWQSPARDRRRKIPHLEFQLPALNEALTCGRERQWLDPCCQGVRAGRPSQLADLFQCVLCAPGETNTLSQLVELSGAISGTIGHHDFNIPATV